MRIILFIVLIVLVSCGPISRVDRSDNTKFVGVLDRDVIFQKGKRFVVKGNTYDVAVDKKGRRFAKLYDGVDNITDGFWVQLNEDNCVTPETGYKASSSRIPTFYIVVDKSKWKFKPSSFCYKVRKLGE